MTRTLWWWSGRLLVPVGAAGVSLGAALPWLEIGGVRRSAFSLARHASELGLVDTPGARAAVIALFLSPAALGVVVIVLAMGWRKTLAAVGAALGLVAWLTGLVGLRFDSTSRQGPLVTALAGSSCLIGALAVLTARSRQHSSVRGVEADEHRTSYGEPQDRVLKHSPNSKDHE